MKTTDMPKIRWHHVVLILTVVVPQLLGASLSVVGHDWFIGLAAASLLGVWLLIPCSDRQFGRGAKYFWMRQTLFASSAVLALLLSLVAYLTKP